MLSMAALTSLSKDFTGNRWFKASKPVSNAHEQLKRLINNKTFDGNYRRKLPPCSSKLDGLVTFFTFSSEMG